MKSYLRSKWYIPRRPAAVIRPRHPAKVVSFRNCLCNRRRYWSGSQKLPVVSLCPSCCGIVRQCGFVDDAQLWSMDSRGCQQQQPQKNPHRRHLSPSTQLSRNYIHATAWPSLSAKIILFTNCQTSNFVIAVSDTLLASGCCVWHFARMVSRWKVVWLETLVCWLP